MEVSKLKAFEDERGSLLPIEFKSLSFEPKRVFIVNGVPINEIRGGHSHHNTKQLIICTKGSIDVILHDGVIEKTYRLEKDEQILVPELVWDEQKFLTKDSEIIVICSTSYDINDYIFDFKEFLKITNDLK